MEGVYRTRVGYAGGTLEDPTYHRLGDHTEVFQIDYDPEVLSYGDILEIFWSSHNPAAKSWSRQYRAVILFHNESQEEAARDSKKTAEQQLGTKIQTAIEPLDRFYLAEDYHQKYYLQNVEELALEIKAYYPDIMDLVESTVAARLNGIAGGYGDPELLERELDSYGLSERGRAIVQDVVY